VNLVDARVTTLGLRAEDAFVVDGAAVEAEENRAAVAEDLRRIVAA